MKRTVAFMLVVTLALLLAGFKLLINATHSEAATCSMVRMPDASERLSFAIDKWSDLVLIGSVVDETRVEPEDGFPPALVRSRNQSKQVAEDEYAIFRSRLRVEAILKGGYPNEEIELPWLSDMYQCVGGPRLLEGTRVLLLMRLWPTWTLHSEPQGLIWQTSLLGGQIILDDEGGAIMADYQSQPEYGLPAGSQYLGTADEVIRNIASKLGASPEVMDAAVAAARSPVLEIDKGIEWSGELTVVALISTLITLGVATAVIRRALLSRQ